MLSFFLQFMKQTYGRSICVQLLQTLNILFENISNETSLCKFENITNLSALQSPSVSQFRIFLLVCFLDYLLSNNHVNQIIVHKFDFSDEEVSHVTSTLTFEARM